MIKLIRPILVLFLLQQSVFASVNATRVEGDELIELGPVQTIQGTGITKFDETTAIINSAGSSIAWLTGYMDTPYLFTTPETPAEVPNYAQVHGFTENDAILVVPPQAAADANGNGIFLQAGAGNGTSYGGTVFLAGGDGGANGPGGEVWLWGGNGGCGPDPFSCGAGTGNGGDILIIAGYAGVAGSGGDVSLISRNGTGETGIGGDIRIELGSGSGSGRNGIVVIYGEGGNGGTVHLDPRIVSGEGTTPDERVITFPSFNGTVVLENNGHIGVGTGCCAGEIPAISACGTNPSFPVNSQSNDAYGKINIGTGAVTSCTITFAHPYSTGGSICMVSNETTEQAFKVVSNTTSLVFSSATDFSGDVVNYLCLGSPI